MIYLLLAIILIIFLIVIYIDKDLFSPSAIICESYLLAVICAIFNIELWNINLGSETVKVILVGILIFVVTSEIIIHTRIGSKNKNKESVPKTIEHIKINKLIYKIIVFIQIITVILYFFYVLKAVGGMSSFANFSNLMNYYRENTSYGELETGIPTYVNQLVKISKIMACITTYIIIKNSLISKKNKISKDPNNKWYIMSTLSYLVLSLLSGGRFGLISYFLFAIVMWKILNDKVYGTISKIDFRKIFKIFMFAIIIIVLFSQLRSLVGRKNEAGIIEYVSGYFGGSIQLLDMFLKNPIKSSEVFGKETFYGINRTLAKFGIVESYKMHLEFRASNGIIIGNVYTSFRNFYYDFGFNGVIILQMVLAIFWSIYYKKIKKQADLSRFDLSLIIYCMFIDKLFLHSYRDTFFSTVITISTITILIYMWFIKRLIIINKEEKMR